MTGAVVNYAAGSWYPRGQARLKESLFPWFVPTRLHGTSADTAALEAEAPNTPYAFKPYFLREAAREGIEHLLWLDASFWAVRNPADLFIQIALDGYLFAGHGHWVGEWTNDRTLDYFRVTRDDAMRIPMVSAGCCGFNIDARASDILHEWWHLRDLFRGRHNNSGGTESRDSRCKGHRHDQSVLSLLIHRDCLNITRGNETFWRVEPGATPPPTAIFHLEGMT